MSDGVFVCCTDMEEQWIASLVAEQQDERVQDAREQEALCFPREYMALVYGITDEEEDAALGAD